MTEKSPHGHEDLMAIYGERSLETMFPELKTYLTAGARVLDVGCGPGNLTLDVAQEVHPGSVIGIDLEGMVQKPQKLDWHF